MGSMADRGAHLLPMPVGPCPKPRREKGVLRERGRLFSCVAALPADQALPAQAQAVAVLGATQT